MNFDFKQVRLQPLMSKERIVHCAASITREVFLHEKLGKYIRRLVGATRPYNDETDWHFRFPSDLVEQHVDLGASPRATICWGRLVKVWALLVRRVTRSIRKISGSGQICPGPPHLARAACRQPRPDAGDGDRRHRGKSADSMKAVVQADLVDMAEIAEIELRILRRMKEVHARRARQRVPRSRRRLSWDCATGSPATACRPSTGRSPPSRTSRPS